MKLDDDIKRAGLDQEREADELVRLVGEHALRTTSDAVEADAATQHYFAWWARELRLGQRPDEVRALQEAQAEGVQSVDAIAAEYGRGNAAVSARASAYLRDNVRYGLGPSEAAGLQRFLDYAADLGLAPGRRQLEFF